MDASTVSREQDRMIEELSEFLSIPSVSALPDHAPDCRRAAEWLVTELERLGCPVVQLVEGEGQPIVWAESPRVEGRPTLLVYGHYDVQPPDPINEWVTPPFSPTVREGRIYARGAADDKGQVYCLLKAYEAARDAQGRPPINVRFIFEGEEESGGHVIYDLLTREPERVQADAVLVCDMSYHAPGWPAVYTALRGICYTEITVRTLQRDLHSGTYGGVAPNALETLVRLLGDLKGRNGKIHVKNLYEAVEPPSKGELKAWRKLPFDEAQYLDGEVTGRALTGRTKYSVFERTWALPTFEIHGIRGGFTGEGAKTVIPAAATAKVSLRLVPGQKMEKVFKWLERSVADATPDYAEVQVRLLHGSDPVQVDVEHPAFEVLDRAFEEIEGRTAVRARAGGSIPIVPELGRGGAPVLLTGIGLPDDGLHSPNEKLDLEQLWRGIQVFARFFQLFADYTPADLAPTKAEKKAKKEIADEFETTRDATAEVEEATS